MAKFPIDFKKFKKIASDKHTTTLEHPGGHTIKITHAALSPDMQKSLHALPMNKGKEMSSNRKSDVKKMPHFDDGGQVSVEPNRGGEQAEPISDKEAYAPNSAPQGAAEVTPEQVQNAPQQMPTPQQSAQVQQQQGTPVNPATESQDDPYGVNTESAAAIGGLRAKESAIPLAAQGQEAQAAKEAAAYNKAANDMQKLNNWHQQNYQQLGNERQNFVHDLDNSHVDPDRFMNNRSTMGKIGTSIGLILGGMGSGTLGGPNPAVVMLNNHIDRDIDAQKAEIGKKENLLSANLRQFGNLRDATDMTRININDTVAQRIRAAAQGEAASNPRIAAAALNAIGQLETDSAARQGNMAMRRTILGAGQPGGAPVQVKPEMKIQALIPEGPERNSYMKDLESAQEAVNARDNLYSASEQLKSINTIGNRVLDPLQSKRQVDSIAGPVIEQLAKDREGRVTPTTVEYLKGLMPMPGDSTDTSKIKEARLHQFVTQKMNFPKLKAIGIDANQMGAYNNQGAPSFTKLPPNIKK